jgi:hypothetical protein
VEYTTNNSGGSFWLSDQKWLDLEQAGWTVMWGEHYDDSTKQVVRYASYQDLVAAGPKARFLNTAARRALIMLPDLPIPDSVLERLAKDVWGIATGMDPDAKGCDCCGPPHAFYVTNEEPGTVTVVLPSPSPSAQKHTNFREGGL